MCHSCRCVEIAVMLGRPDEHRTVSWSKARSSGQRSELGWGCWISLLVDGIFCGRKLGISGGTARRIKKELKNMT